MSADSTLPSGWTVARAGELFDMQLGKMLSKQASAGPEQARYLANRHVQWDRVVLDDLDTMSFSEAERTKYTLAPGDLLVCEGGEIGRTAMWRGELSNVFFQKAIHRLRPRTDGVTPGYMLRYMRLASERGLFADLSSQTSIAHLTQEKLALLPVQLPPVDEQRCIAKILDTFDDAVRKTEQLVAKLKQMKQGLLHDLLTRGIDENGELRDPERDPESFKKSSPALLPFTWQELPCGAITAAPICYGIVQAGPYVPHGPLVLTIGDLKGDFRSGLHRTSPRIDENYARSRVRPDDVLLSIKGTIGRVAVVPAWYEGNISRDMARLRLVSSVVPEFVRQYLLSPSGQRRLELAVVGTTRAEVSIHVLRRLRIPIPPRAEQVEIARRLEAADTSIATMDMEVNKLRLLKQGLMDDLLTGRVRVTPLLGEASP